MDYATGSPLAGRQLARSSWPKPSITRSAAEMSCSSLKPLRMPMQNIPALLADSTPLWLSSITVQSSGLTWSLLAV